MPEKKMVKPEEEAEDRTGLGDWTSLGTLISNASQRRARNIRRLLLILATASLVTIAFDTALFVRDSSVWQTFVAGGAAGVALLLIPIAYRLTREDKLDGAGYLVLVGITTVFVVNEMVLSGATLYFVLAGMLTFFLAGYVALPGRPRPPLLAFGLFLLSVVLANLVQPLPRYAIASSPAVNVFVPVISVVIAAAIVWVAARTFRVGTIRTRLLIAFLGITLLPVSILLGGLLVGGLQSAQASGASSMAGIATGVGLLGVFIAVAASLLITRSIANPLSALARTSSEIAAGDLTRTATIERQDEIGLLSQAFNSMTAQLRGLIASLEDRVQERTRELERRTNYLQATAVVGQAAASILEPDELGRQVVELIREQFELYYVGLFLVDQTREWAILRAGTGTAGVAMLARGHQHKVGVGMVGWSIAHAEPRVALEAEQDTVRLATSELPETRSEAALPLRSRGRVLGALTVQHTQPGAFDRETIIVLQTMADLVAVALDNANLFAERQEAVEAVQRAYGELSIEAWSQILRRRQHLGFRSDQDGVTEAGDVWWPEMEEAVRTGQTVPGKRAAGDDQATVAIPIKVRGQAVGVVHTHRPADAGNWTSEELSLLESIAEQLGPALESARLYQDTLRRAAREQAIRQVTEQMRRSVDVDAILQATVAELARAMGAPRAYVRLGTEADLRAGDQARAHGQALETRQEMSLQQPVGS
jgi:GAF domain-containing protein/HAMP domain-containing protein